MAIGDILGGVFGSAGSERADWYQSRETLMSWFGVSTPILESDFYFKFQRFQRTIAQAQLFNGDIIRVQTNYYGNQNTDVSNQGAIAVGAPMINVKSVSVPPVGVAYNNSPELLWQLQPTIQIAPIQLSFYQRTRTEDVASWITLFASPYNAKGTLSLQALKNQIDVEIGIIVGEKDVPLLQLNDCKFSYPTPNLDAQSNGLMVFTTTIAYNNFKVIENASQNRTY